MNENKTQMDAMPWKILLILCLASFTGPFMGSAFNLALPEIASAYSFKAITLTWFSTGFLLSMAIFQIPLARLADLVGRKRIYLIGLFGLSFATLAAPFVPTGNMMIALRMLQGLFAAMMSASNMAILMSVVPAGHRAVALSLNTASVYSALAIGPFVGGFLTHYAGWQSIFYVSAGLVMVVFIASCLFLKGEWTEARGEKFDYPGSLIFAVSIVGIICGFTALPHAQGFTALGIGIAALVLFVFYESKVKSPVVDIRLFFSNRVFMLACLAALINYSANSATSFMLSLYLQYIRGYEASLAGLVLIAQAVVQVVASVASGRLSERFIPSSIATFGMVVSVLGLAALCFVTPATSTVYILGCLAVLGAGFGLFSSPNMNIIMSSVEKKHYGQASATTGTVRLTGQAFSMGIAGMAISLYVGNRQLVPEVYPQFMHSFKITFIIFVVMCLVGVYASAARNRQIKKIS